MYPKSVAEAILLLGLMNQPTTATCVGSQVSVRLPPTVSNPNTGSNWKSPPIGWDFGYWYQTNSSSPNSFQRNLQYSTLPLDPARPAGQRSDLSSFQIVTNDTVYTSYGEDTPTPIPGVYHYQGTGILKDANDTLEIIAWGYDCRGEGYRISYSTVTEFTKTPASLDVLSRTKKGPDAVTLKKIQDALVAFGNAEVTALAKAIGPALQDRARDGQPPIQECDDYCKSNEDLLGLF